MLNTKNMEYRRLGNTGLKVSILSFGNAMSYKPQTAEIDDALIVKCLESGINYFDTAEMYADGTHYLHIGEMWSSRQKYGR
jgi:aryl-alcohol dehydrogenase-like predicted oxidoreductase